MLFVKFFQDILNTNYGFTKTNGSRIFNKREIISVGSALRVESDLKTKRIFNKWENMMT